MTARRPEHCLPRWLSGRALDAGHDGAGFVVGAAIGTGMIARAAEAGGADFLLALSAGRIRVMGAASIACHLAVYDANRFVMDFARAEILDRVSVPVLFGASVFEPKLDIDRLLDRIADAGFAGVANFPSAIHLDGRVGQALEAHGLGYPRELDLIARARARGQATVGYARTARQAEAMAEAGADMVCLNFGWNAGGRTNLPSALDLDEAAAMAERVFARLRHRRPDAVCTVEGGPIQTVEDAAKVCRLARADGYIGGSTIDRLPLEAAVSEATSAYKSLVTLENRIETLQDTMLGDGRRYGLIGRSPLLGETIDFIERFAATDLSVLVLGANGTGKELVARALHDAGHRRSGPFVAINCAAIPRDLLESELFGSEKGAFTGATARRIGRFEEATGGTLFLDEIGDMHADLQAKLLRILESGVFERVGGSRQVQTDVRVVCATNRDLAERISDGRFRADLYYRLNAVEIRLPALSDRLEDIPLLVQHFLETSVRTLAPAVQSLDGGALRHLVDHDWPGNVRELKNALERAAVMADGDRIEARHLPALGARPDGGERNVRLQAAYEGRPAVESMATSSLPLASPAFDGPSAEVENEDAGGERAWILRALRRHRFRRGETAAALGLSRKTLYNKIKRYGLDA